MGGRIFISVVVLLIGSDLAVGEDWPQFHGPRQDNRSTDTGLLKQWPEGGPGLVWRVAELGHGFASVAIAEGMIYTTGETGGDNVITAMDMAGNKLWRRKNGPAYMRSHPGTRSTPTIAEGKLYNLSGVGNLICIDAKTGSPVWTVDIMEKFGGRIPRWGIAESPVIDGDNVICFPGGEDVGMVALNKDTGDTVWTSRDIGDMPGYATAVIVDYQGLRQVVTQTSHSIVGVAAQTGKLLWKYPHKVSHEANCDTPLYHDGHLFVFGTWGRGATMLKLNVRGEDCTVEEIWRTRELDNEHGGVMIVDGYLYGQADGDHKDRHLACLEAATGKTMWTARQLAGRASATLTFAEGLFYVVSDRAEVALVRPAPKRLEILSQFQLPKDGKGELRARPVVCGKRLYIRHGEYLYAYEIREKTAEAEPAR